jgi:hypothetical protein
MAILPVCRSKRENIFACAQGGCSECLEALLEKHNRSIDDRSELFRHYIKPLFSDLLQKFSR